MAEGDTVGCAESGGLRFMNLFSFESNPDTNDGSREFPSVRYAWGRKTSRSGDAFFSSI